MNNIELSIVLPTYNERENIKILIPKIEDIFKDIKHEIIVVDDSSPDRTAECVLDLNKTYNNIRLINRKKKEGIGAALCEGYNNARGSIIISSDTDLSFSVDDMVKLVNAIKDGYDLVIGCRHNIKGSFYEMKRLNTFIKGFISRSGNTLLTILTRMNIHDFSANFRAIKKEAWQELSIKETNNIMLFEMIIKARHKRMKIVEVPVSFVDRIYGKSKLNLFFEIPKVILKIIYYLIIYR